MKFGGQIVAGAIDRKDELGSAVALGGAGEVGRIDELLGDAFLGSIRRWLLTTPATATAVLIIFAITDATRTGVYFVIILLGGAVLHGTLVRQQQPQQPRQQDRRQRRRVGDLLPIIGYPVYLAAFAALPAFALPATVNGQIGLLLIIAIGLPLAGIALSANRRAALATTTVGGLTSVAGWMAQPDAFDPRLPEVVLISTTVLSLAVIGEVSNQQIQLATATVHGESSRQIDPLTNLYRRSTFLDMLDESLLNNPTGGLYFIDIDRFKVVNDTLGHQVGDQLLLAAAERITRTLGRGDFAGRIGGDEVGVYISGQTPDLITATALRLTQLFDKDFQLIDHRVPVAVSVSAVAADGSSNGRVLMHQAAIAMHAAKRDGRRLRIFDNKMRSELMRLEQTELDLRTALRNGKVRAHLQPIVDLKAGTVASFEALGRWTRDGLAVPAADFFVSAKQSNLLPDITRAVAADLIEFSHSISDLHAAADRSDLPTLGINVEAGDLGAFLTWIDDQPVDPANWLVELTETQLLDSHEEAVRDVRRAVDMGVGVVLDDFGTGYSSLYRILHLPLAGLKIDALFVAQILHSNAARSIVSSTAHIAASCGLDIVAEGVETREQAEALLDLGITKMQGYYFCRPVDVATTLAIVRDIWAEGAGPIPLQPSSQMRPSDHYLCNFADIERLIVRAREGTAMEHRSSLTS